MNPAALPMDEKGPALSRWVRTALRPFRDWRGLWESVGAGDSLAAPVAFGYLWALAAAPLILGALVLAVASIQRTLGDQAIQAYDRALGRAPGSLVAYLLWPLLGTFLVGILTHLSLHVLEPNARGEIRRTMRVVGFAFAWMLPVQALINAGGLWLLMNPEGAKGLLPSAVAVRDLGPYYRGLTVFEFAQRWALFLFFTWGLEVAHRSRLWKTALAALPAVAVAGFLISHGGMAVNRKCANAALPIRLAQFRAMPPIDFSFLLGFGPRTRPLPVFMEEEGHRVFFEHQSDVNGIEITAVGFSPDGRYLASLDRAGHLVLRDLLLQRYWSWPAHTQEGRCLAFSPDSTTLATAGKDTTDDDDAIRIWRVRDRGKALTLTWDKPVESLAFAGNQKLLGSGWLFGVTAWSLPGGKVVQELGPPMGDGHLTGLCVGPEGWITAAGDQAYYFWADSGQPPLVMSRSQSVAFALPKMVGGRPVLVARQPGGITILAREPLPPYLLINGRTLWAEPPLGYGGLVGGRNHVNDLAVADDLSFILTQDERRCWRVWVDEDPVPLTLRPAMPMPTAMALDPIRHRFAYGDGQPFVHLVTLP